MDTGFITLHRKIIDNPVWKNSQLSHLFIHLLLLATYGDTKFLWNGKEEVLKRGQLITGRYALAEATGISPNTIKGYLKILENIGIITRKSTNKFTIITIIKYNQYQDRRVNHTTKDTSQTPARHQPDTTFNNINKDNNINKESGDKSPTPSQVAKEFFNQETTRRNIGIQLAEKYGVDLKAIAEEIRKFTQYWTEPNKSGTRQRWETEKTFEVSRRLEKWFSNIKHFKSDNKPTTTINLNEI